MGKVIPIEWGKPEVRRQMRAFWKALEGLELIRVPNSDTSGWIRIDVRKVRVLDRR